MLATGGANFFWNMGLGVLIVYLVRTLDLSPAVLGLVLAVGEVGTVVGASSRAGPRGASGSAARSCARRS
ncbi:MAG: hypothetical protein M3364_03040 [Actinomycetota bacterium]|nr:hypothetical protein [Actinomycetota bacterium]